MKPGAKFQLVSFISNEEEDSDDKLFCCDPFTGCENGRIIVKTEPFSGTLVADMKPLCFSTIFLQIDKPIPVPSNK